jgi:tetratricopeptide (TPR) repeat protein
MGGYIKGEVSMNSKFFKHTVPILGLVFLGFLVLGCATTADTYINRAERTLAGYSGYYISSSGYDYIYKACNKAINIDPNAARAYFLRGKVSVKRGDWLYRNSGYNYKDDAAAADFKESVSEFDLAIADFNKAIALDSSLEKEAKAEIANIQAKFYDPNDFITVPILGRFHPDFYRSADLFSAVAAAEKLDISEQLQFVSDVVVIGQNGTDIGFRTTDNAISQAMKVNVRTGLTAGQQVRVYYWAYRIKDWQVIAIKLL